MSIGIGGTLYPPQFCRLIDDSAPKYILDKDLLIRDDFFLHQIALKNCIGTKVVECRHPFLEFCGFLIDHPIIPLTDQ